MTEPTLWNRWWTVALVGAIFTVVVAILEALGVFHDLGVALGFIGLVVTSFFGAAGATNTAIATVHREIDAIHDTLRHSLIVQNTIVSLLEERSHL